MAPVYRAGLSVMPSGSNVGCIADVHLGNHRLFGGQEVGGLNARWHIGLTVLGGALDYALKNLDTLIILGDLFDTHRPSPQMITSVQRLLFKYADVKVFIIRGNHDMVDEAQWNNALGPLHERAMIVDSKPVWLDCGRAGTFLLAPYKSGPASVWIKEYIDLIEGEKLGEDGVLATHVGLIHGKTPPWLRAAHDAVEVAELRGVTTIAGNWHESKAASNWIQCGALMPTGFDNPSPTDPVTTNDVYGALWRTNTSCRWDRHTISGPRFWIRPWETVEAWVKARTARSVSGFDYLKIKAAPEDVPAAMAYLAELRHRGTILDGIVEPDASDVALAHKAQVRAVNSASSIDEALDAFLRKQQMPEGVAAPVVGELTREYIKQAQKHGDR